MIDIVNDFNKYYEQNKQQQQKLGYDDGNDDDDDDDDDDDIPILDGTKSSSKIHHESDGIYSFDCLNEYFLQLMNEELYKFYPKTQENDIEVRRPNSMNNYRVILNEIGMRSMVTSLQQQYKWPISRVLFPKQGRQFDDHHSFIVRYQADED
jgi:hypothetical protein